MTVLVWLGVSMSEVHDYPLHVKVEMTGYDTVRFAVVHADTDLHMQVGMDGFNAAAMSLFRIGPTVKVDMSEGGLYRSVAVDDIADNLKYQLQSLGIRHVASSHDSLRLQLAQRGQRTYKVNLDSVSFSFAEQYGLYGEPRVSPSHVTLYGADSLLASISTIGIKRTSIDGISGSATYRLRLDPVWEQLGDVRSNYSDVDVFVPVETYVEREYSVPLTVDGADTSVRMRLYPEVVKVRVWVARCDLDRTPDFRVAINYADVLTDGGYLKPRLVQFPSWVRPRAIVPDVVQCVVIKG